MKSPLTVYCFLSNREREPNRKYCKYKVTLTRQWVHFAAAAGSSWTGWHSTDGETLYTRQCSSLHWMVVSLAIFHEPGTFLSFSTPPQRWKVHSKVFLSSTRRLLWRWLFAAKRTAIPRQRRKYEGTARNKSHNGAIALRDELRQDLKILDREYTSLVPSLVIVDNTCKELYCFSSFSILAWSFSPSVIDKKKTKENCQT